MDMECRLGASEADQKLGAFDGRDVRALGIVNEGIICSCGECTKKVENGGLNGAGSDMNLDLKTEMGSGGNGVVEDPFLLKRSCFEESKISDEKGGDRADQFSCKCTLISKVRDLESHDECALYLSKDLDLGPATPLPPDRENVEASTSSDQNEEADSSSGCMTPTKGVFDPFAPGPEELMFAPKKRMLKQARPSLRRQLKFDSCCDSKNSSCCDSKDIVQCDIVPDEAVEEEKYLELLYRSFLDAIVSNQVGESSDVSLQAESVLSDGLKTPTTLPLLTGVAETCPGAPMRPASKSRKLGMGICRKLEF